MQTLFLPSKKGTADLESGLNSHKNCYIACTLPSQDIEVFMQDGYVYSPEHLLRKKFKIKLHDAIQMTIGDEIKNYIDIDMTAACQKNFKLPARVQTSDKISLPFFTFFGGQK